MSEKPAVRDLDEGAWRKLRHYVYVDRPYAQGLRLVSTSPWLGVGGPGVTSGGPGRLTEFHLRRAGLDIARDVRVTLGSLQPGELGARLPIVDEIAARLEAEIEPIRLVPSPVSPGADGVSRRQRVFLPIDGLGYRLGGAAGLEARLRAEPGVLRAEVDAVAELAVVEYDATTSSRGRLLTIIDPHGDTPEMEVGNGRA